MSKYRNALYPDKANDFIDNEGNFKGEAVGSVIPLIEDPLEDNLSTEIKVVSLNEEPGIRYKGYVYAIGLRYFPIEFELTNCTISIEQPISIKETQDLEFYIIPNEGYDLDPEGLFVIGIDDYTYNPETGYVKLENPLGSVFVGCMCSKMVNVHYDLYHIALDPMPTKIRKTVNRTTLTASATGGADYRVSERFLDCVGATVRFNSLLNTITISNITAEDDIYIHMEAATRITAETNITNGSCTISPSTLWTDSFGGGSITPTSGYGYPDSVTATGFFGFSYNSSTGQFSFSQSNPIEGTTVTITAECPRVYPIISGTEHVVTTQNNPTMRASDTKQIQLRGEDSHYRDIIVTNVIGASSWSYDSNTSTVTIAGVAAGYDEVEIISTYTYYYLFSSSINRCYVDFDSSSTSDPSAVINGSVAFQYSDDEDYFNLPSTITVSNAELIDYDSSTGDFSFTNITGDVLISGQAVRIAVRVSILDPDHYTVYRDNHWAIIYDDSPLSLGSYNIEIEATEPYKFKTDGSSDYIYIEGSQYRPVSFTYETDERIVCSVDVGSTDDTLYINVVGHSPESFSGDGDDDEEDYQY